MQQDYRHKNDHSVFIKQTSTRYDDIKRNRRVISKKRSVHDVLSACHGYSGIYDQYCETMTLLAEAMTSKVGYGEQERATRQLCQISRRKNLTSWKICHCRLTFDIESSRDSFIKEGWARLDEQKIAR